MLNVAARRLSHQVPMNPTLHSPAAVIAWNQLVSANGNLRQQQKRQFMSKTLYNLARGVLPPISKTEQIALGCGTIGKLKGLVGAFRALLSRLRPNLHDRRRFQSLSRIRS